ncbi:MFS family permease [Streptomyces calvus]|uniref:MFS transporter n=1 Tax=Streptomyces calvus TaxID=67282 RepID=UPI00359690A2
MGERGERRRVRAGLLPLDGPLRFLLLSSFLIPLGSFMVLPFMSVFLHERLGMGLGSVGVVLAVASLVQFSGGVVGGALADRIGLRRTMLWALVVRTAGFVGLLLALRWPPLAVGALVLTCCGAALYLPANKAYLVHGVDEERRPAFLSAGNAALNAGMALGPLIAGPFVLSAPGRLFLAVTALFVLVTAGHARLPDAGGKDRPVPGRALPDRPAGVALLPFAANALAFYLYFHFQHFLAVYAVERASGAFYGVVLLLCFTLVVVVQPLTAGLIRRMPYALALAAGFRGAGGRAGRPGDRHADGAAGGRCADHPGRHRAVPEERPGGAAPQHVLRRGGLRPAAAGRGPGRLRERSAGRAAVRPR